MEDFHCFDLCLLCKRHLNSDACESCEDGSRFEPKLEAENPRVCGNRPFGMDEIGHLGRGQKVGFLLWLAQRTDKDLLDANRTGR